MNRAFAKDIAVEIDFPEEREGLVYVDVTKPPFKLHGVYLEDGLLRRAPEAVAAATSENVCRLAKNTAGGRVRFSVKGTSCLKLHVESPDPEWTWHISPGTGTFGMDLYKNGSFNQITFPYKDDYTFGRWWGEDEEPVLTLNLPISRKISKLLIGVEEGAEIIEAPDYSLKKPIVFYGSSITQGNCSSRPGMSYENILSRKLDFDYINLGFSGSAKGEDAIADYIATLDMSIFVLDYDHNAPNPDHLRGTHEKMFLKVREKHPDLPILILTRPRPKHKLIGDVATRQEVVRETYENALARGDKNVWYIPGTELIRDEIADDWSVDGIHPTDLGFFSMADAIAPTLEKMIKLVKDRNVK
jgi:hypothetical protein